MVRMVRGAAAVATCLVLANCASSSKFASRVDPKYGVSSSPRVVALGDPVPKGGGTYRVGKPYTVGGRIYVPEDDVRWEHFERTEHHTVCPFKGEADYWTLMLPLTN